MDFQNPVGSAPDPKMKNGVYPVGLVYDDMSSSVELQILRDLTTIAQQWPIEVTDNGGRLDLGLLRHAGLTITREPAVLNLVYKTGDEWPYVDPEVQAVYRDLQVKKTAPNIGKSSEVGYYLRPQGRDGANLTELYLNRTAPRGNGLSDAMVVLLWG